MKPKKIVDLRQRMDLTQNELAVILGVYQAIVSRWESGLGKPKAQSFNLLCAFDEVNFRRNVWPGRISKVLRERGQSYTLWFILNLKFGSRNEKKSEVQTKSKHRVYAVQRKPCLRIQKADVRWKLR